MTIDRPKSLRLLEAREALLAMLAEDHILPLTNFVRQARSERGLGTEIPYFDPLDGGVSASTLFILEAPGPKAVKSGFVSRNNPDETAKNMFEFLAEVGFSRKETLLWNIVPWYISSGDKIRAANSQDIREGLEYLVRLIELLPNLGSLVLVGKKAARVREQLSDSAADLQKKVFPPIKWIVPDLLPEGLTLLCGRPKTGKSWLALDIAQAVTLGGSVLGRECVAGATLYLALEDNERRLQKRLQCVQGLGAWPAGLDLATEAPKLGAGCLRGIRQWCVDHPGVRMVIIDTLATVRPDGKRNENDYTADYAALRGLQRLSGELGIAIVVIHHVRKAEADDPFDTVSGSTGLTGAADATLVLTKRAGDGGCILYGRGRDLAEFELAVEFDSDICRWRSLGNPVEAFASETKRGILAAMQTGAQTPAKISEVSGIDYELTKKTLQRMADGRELGKDGRGRYYQSEDPLS